MANSTFNDYSGLGSLFKGSAFGILISTGILSTLVPNTIDSVGQVRGLNSFFALNLFSVVYFVLPIIIFTSYWLMRGSRLFLIEKFNKFEALRYKSLSKDDVEKNDWPKFLFLFAKLLPLCAFIYNPGVYSGFLLVVVMLLYLVISPVQLFYGKWSNGQWLELKKMGLTVDRQNELLYRSFCIDSLIYFLDFILGIALVVFSEPWIVYQPLFYAFAASSIVLYAVAGWAYSLYRFDKARLNVQDFVVALLLSAAGLSIPALNLKWYACLFCISIILFVLVAIGWAVSEKGIKEGERGKIISVVVPSVVIALATILVLHNVIHRGVMRANINYCKSRFEASQQISNYELFPFAKDLKPDLSQADLVANENKYADVYLTIPSLSKKLQFAKRDAPENLRAVYYEAYNQMQLHWAADHKTNYNNELDDKFRSQDQIDSLYEKIFEHVLRIQIDGLRDTLRHRKLPSALNRLEKYLHPLDYAGSKLERLRRLKDGAGKMIEIAESLLSNWLIVNSKLGPDSTARKIFESRNSSLLKRLDSLYKNSIELRELPPIVNAMKKDSLHLVGLIKFQKLFFEYREQAYIRSYEGTQKVYRSYLVDSQRIGVWAFLVTVLVLALATFFNNFSDVELGSLVKSLQADKNDSPIDTPRNALFVQTVAVTLLLVPLVKDIQPENIDPEKSLWMVSLQNWHTPTFIKVLTDKDYDKHFYSPSSPSVTVDFKVLEQSLRELNQTVAKEQSSLDAIGKNIKGVQTQIANDDGQKVKRP